MGWDGERLARLSTVSDRRTDGRGVAGTQLAVNANFTTPNMQQRYQLSPPNPPPLGIHVSVARTTSPSLLPSPSTSWTARSTRSSFSHCLSPFPLSFNLARYGSSLPTAPLLPLVYVRYALPMHPSHMHIWLRHSPISLARSSPSSLVLLFSTYAYPY